MKQLRVVAFLFASGLISASGFAQVTGPSPVLPEKLIWASPRPGVQVAWVLGADKTPGPYILRVKLAPGAQVPPHTHPDERNSTVLAGTIYVGFGANIEELKMVAIPSGGVYVAPATVAHYIWAKDGDAMYQESGIGPTATIPITR